MYKILSDLGPIAKKDLRKALDPGGAEHSAPRATSLARTTL